MDDSSVVIAGDASAEVQDLIRSKYNETVYAAYQTTTIKRSEIRQGVAFCLRTSARGSFELRKHVEHVEKNVHAVITRDFFSVFPLTGEPENVQFESVSRIYTKRVNGLTTLRIDIKPAFWNANTGLRRFRVAPRTIALVREISFELPHHLIDSCLPLQYLDKPKEFKRYLQAAKQGRYSIFSTQEIIEGKIGEEAAYDAFLAHDWGRDSLGRDNEERVKLVNELLKDKGLITWFHGDRLKGRDVALKLASGIEKSKKFVVFLTQQYLEKVNGDNVDDICKREFLYAAKQKGIRKFVVAVMEEAMLDKNAWSGQLDFVVGWASCIDMTTNDKIHKNIGSLIKELSPEAEV